MECPGLRSPIERHALTYDSNAEYLEQIYFWIIDYLEARYGRVEKLVDTFVSSPGSSHFSEIAGRAMRMQDRALKMLDMARKAFQSILRLVRDIKKSEGIPEDEVQMKRIALRE